MTSLLEICNPLWAWVDGCIDVFGPFVRLLVWGALVGALSMSIYWLISPQQRLERLATDVVALIRSMRANGATGSGFSAVAGEALKLALKRMGLTLAPTLLASIPIFLVIGFLDGAYGLKSAIPGEPVAVIPGSGKQILVDGGQQFKSGWTVAWPEGPETVRVFDSDHNHIFTLTPDALPGTARKPGFAFFLFGAQAGQLERRSLVDSLKIETTPQAIIQPELSAPYQWTVPFVFSLILVSVMVKVVFRIT